MTDRVFSWFIVFLLKLIDKEGWRATGLQPASILPKQENGSGWVQAFVDYYIGRHIARTSRADAMTTLSPEVVRAGPEMHAAYETKMKNAAQGRGQCLVF